MRRFIRSIFALVLLIAIPFNGWAQATSWENAKENGEGTLTIAYSENSPFIYQNDKGDLEGIEYELLLTFTNYVQQNYNVRLNLEWEHYSIFNALIDSLKTTQRPIIGIASLSITEERKKEMKFCTPYMPDIEIIVSSSQLGTANNLNDFAKIVKNNTAIAVANSTFEKNIIDIRDHYFPTIKIDYVPHVDLLIDSVASNDHYWGYIALPNYLSYFKNGKNINRQRFFMVENIGLSIATPMRSDWNIPLTEFIENPEFDQFINQLIASYLGDTFKNVVASISDKNRTSGPTIATNKEVGVLTLERELQDLKIRESELKLHNKNIIIYSTIIGIFLISVALLGVYRLMRLKSKTNAMLSEKNEEIAAQADTLKNSYENLKRLSNIGQEITSSLSVDKINEIVYNKLLGLMDIDVFGIGIYNPDESALQFTGVVEKGQQLESFSYNDTDENRLAITCFKNRSEIVIKNMEVEYKSYLPTFVPAIAGRDAQSIIYMPLIVGNKPIGVLTVQSYKKDAFDAHEVDVVRNVANYAKTALENASAYEQIYRQKEILKTANEQIVEKNEHIERQNHELLDLNKEKNDLISIVAHDLKNPLTSAMSVADLFQDDPLTTEQKEYLYLINKCLKRMNGLISKILDIKLIEAKTLNLHIGPTNVKSVVEHVVNELKIQGLKKHIKIETQLEECTTQLDKGLFMQVVDNLLSNAMKFSQPGTKVYVTLEVLANEVRLKVKDEGPGISKEDQTKLFQKFQRLSAKPTAGEDSTGLGLSIVKKYVEAMNGKVWCESEKGKGASFIVAFNTTP